MDANLLIICLLTFVIHVVGTLSYSVRIAGTRTGRIAISLSLFNILVLVSRTSNSFQAPLLAKRVEENLIEGVTTGVAADFRWLILSASVATIVGAVLIPTFQRLFSRAVDSFSAHKSVPRLLMRGFMPTGFAHIRESLRLPTIANVTTASSGDRIPTRVIVFNTLAVAIWTVGVFSALYAGYLEPELRVTASQLSAVINGVATILLFVFIDPHLSVLTDEVAEGSRSDSSFRRSIVWLVGSRLAGTLLAQHVFIPAAIFIRFVAQRL